MWKKWDRRYAAKQEGAEKNQRDTRVTNSGFTLILLIQT
jgi:hypothetical protein